MKKIIYIILIILLPFYIYGQPCTNNVKTDPANAVNNEFTGLTNTFNWMNSSWPVTSSYYNNAGMTTIGSPFYYSSGTCTFLWTNKTPIPGALDYYPDDGWELIKRGMGLYYSGTQNGDILVPYLILYNKFSTTLRVFAAVGEEHSDHNGMRISIEFANPLNNSNGLLSNHADVINALDVKTKVVRVQSAVPYINDKQVFAMADFPMGYDPCACIFNSDLKVSIDLVSVASINLWGRILGTSTTISDITSKNTGNVKNNNFLSSISTDYYHDDIKSGVIIYKDIQELIDHNKDLEILAGTPDVNPNMTVYMSMLKAGLELGSTLSEGNPELALGLEAGSVVMDFFTEQSNKKEGSDNNNMPTVIKGEMAFTGQITEDFPMAIYPLQVPGSLGTHNPLSSLPDKWDLKERDYPTYNEILGLFTLIKTPPVTNYTQPGVVHSETGPNNTFTNFIHEGRFSVKLNEDIKYKVNPVVKDKPSKRTILGRYVLKLKLKTDRSNIIFDCENADIAYEIGKPDDDSVIFMSPLLPVECLKNWQPVIHWTAVDHIHADFRFFGGDVFLNDNIAPNISDMETYIRLAVDYEFEQLDRDGNNIRTTQILTFATKGQNWWAGGNEDRNGSGAGCFGCTIPPHNIMPKNLTLNTQTFTTNDEIYASGDITIQGNLTLASGVNWKTIVAGRHIFVNSTSTIGNGITLRLGYPSCGAKPLEVTDPELVSFCNYQGGGAYKAYQFNGLVGPDIDKSKRTRKTKANFINSFKVYPNPFNTFTNIDYNIASMQKVMITITDIYGANITTLVDSLQDEGHYQLKFDASSLASGVYFCTIRYGNAIRTEKLIIVK
jgi:hypothetical protein